MWEHERNKNGGRLVILFKKGGTGKDAYARELKVTEDKLWLEIVSVCPMIGLQIVPVYHHGLKLKLFLFELFSLELL